MFDRGLAPAAATTPARELESAAHAVAPAIEEFDEDETDPALAALLADS